MMFAEQYPESVASVISLDSLRYPFPTKDHIPILTFRANDTKEDDNVLPKSEVTLVSLKDVKHIDMCDRGPTAGKKRIVGTIMEFLSSSLKE